jgi:hypothetical protein
VVVVVVELAAAMELGRRTSVLEVVEPGVVSEEVMLDPI